MMFQDQPELVPWVDAGRTDEPRTKREPKLCQSGSAAWDQSKPRESALLCYQQAVLVGRSTAPK